MKTILRLALTTFALTSAALSLASVQIFTAFLDGPSEATPNASPGVGTAMVTIDDVVKSMRVEVSFSGLLGTTTASHIHAATPSPNSGAAGVATQTPTFTGFPSGVTSGTYDHTFDMTASASWNASYLAAHGGTTDQAFSDFLAAIVAEKAYLNIHSSVFTGGEIRGFLHAVPEPATMALLGFGVLPLLRRRQK